ncbi:MAG TPA: 2-oxo-4-hydroxy-4-carboxy-5-ureidoimidazoline decarboxylase [Vicinamibacterales bacterium]|nr:2-oxo-4-hydroxy-4-carboxy-5-ureidoimidazoline decarboxylase [Vicinamibacterales bacterium]
MTIAELNASDAARFVAVLREVWEESPWVSERAWERRPFASVDHLHAVMADVVAAASRDEQLCLLRAHPELGARRHMSAASTREQAGVRLDRLEAAEVARLDRLNAAYRLKFSFPFLFAVSGSSTHDVIDALERRLPRTLDDEFEEALHQVSRIARLRLQPLLA